MKIILIRAVLKLMGINTKELPKEAMEDICDIMQKCIQFMKTPHKLKHINEFFKLFEK